METPMNFKIVVIGEKSVGKTSIVSAFINNYYIGNHKSTIGCGFHNKILDLNGTRVNLQIFDTSGEERFRAVTPTYFRNAHGAVLVYDVTERKTFEELEYWIRELHNYLDEDIPYLLVGNKADQQKDVTEEEGRYLASKHGMLFREVSAKNNAGIQSAFVHLTQKVTTEE